MERIKNKTILIGKDPSEGRLLVAIAGGKVAAIGAPGSVPASVSRCRLAENIAHAKITVDNNGNMILANMKPQNVTFVNGSEVVSKRITSDTRVELGKDRFNVNLPLVIDTAVKLASLINSNSSSQQQQQQPQPQKEVQTYNIKHLERVWNEYHNSLKELRAKQKKINLIRSGCGIFTMCAMPCIFFLGPVGYALTGVGIIGNIYSFVGLKNDNTPEEQEKLTEEFQDSYVCPNPDCNKFFGNTSYRLLKKQYSMKCPYCKSNFVEK